MLECSNLTPSPSPKERGVSYTQLFFDCFFQKEYNARIAKLYPFLAPLSFGEGLGVRSPIVLFSIKYQRGVRLTP